MKHKTRIDTYKYYKKHLDNILGYVFSEGITSIDDINDETLYDYIEYQKLRSLKNNTINKSFGTLKQGLKYCEKRKIIRTSPMKDFVLLTKDDVETKIIPTECINKIFDYVDNLNNYILLNLRHKSAIYLLLDTGIRLNKLYNLRVRSFNFQKDIISLKYARTHGNRDLLMSMTASLIVQEYIIKCEVEDYIKIDLRTREHTCKNNLYKFILEMKGNLQIPDEVSISFHKFRHTYATTCLESGANLDSYVKH